MLKSHEQALKTMNNEEGLNLCSESVLVYSYLLVTSKCP